MALKLPDSAVPMGDFPVAKAVDIDFNDGENLQDKFDNGELGGGGITNVKTYCLLSQLGITTPCTIKDIWDKMPSGSITIIDADSSIVTDLDVIRIALGFSGDDEIYGILTVVKLNERTTLEFRRARTGKSMVPDTFIGYCKGSDCTSIQWKQIAFTTQEKQDFRIFKSLEEFNEKKGTSFTVVSGVDNMADIVNAMTEGDMLIITTKCATGSEIYFGLDSSTGWTKTFTFIKANGLCDVECCTTVPSTYKRVLDTDGVVGDWKELATMDKVDELFQSVSDGKTLVANAITDKGVSTSTTATFATMATNISKISGGYKEETKSYNTTSSGATRLVFTFSADVSGVKQITPPSDASSHIVPETTTSMFTVNGKNLTLYVKGIGTWKVTAMVRNA